MKMMGVQGVDMNETATVRVGGFINTDININRQTQCNPSQSNDLLKIPLKGNASKQPKDAEISRSKKRTSAWRRSQR